MLSFKELKFYAHDLPLWMFDYQNDYVLDDILDSKWIFKHLITTGGHLGEFSSVWRPYRPS